MGARMFSVNMGGPADLAGRAAILARRGDRGHAIHGPYEPVRPGGYRVDFALALADASARGADGGDPVCATLDVTAHSGAVRLASREVRRSELSTEPRTFALSFMLREFRTLEFRVHAAGAVDFIAAAPALVELGPVVGPVPPVDPLADDPDPVALHHQVRAVLRLLRPQRARGFGKVRLGRRGDGGYVCLDDFAGLDAALSFGINDDVSWDRDAADRGLVVHQFDHTVDDPAPDDRRMVFNKTMIAPEPGPGAATLGELVRLHDRGASRPNLLLKMDIEGWEWAMVEATPSHELARFSQIACELHYFQGLAELDHRRTVFRALTKLHELYGVVHVHANVAGGIGNHGNVVVPNVLEVTFANRALYALEDTDELFPGPLDDCCDPNQPDMFLGSFRF